MTNENENTPPVKVAMNLGIVNVDRRTKAWFTSLGEQTLSTVGVRFQQMAIFCKANGFQQTAPRQWDAPELDSVEDGKL